VLELILHIAITSVLLCMLPWHVQGEYHLYKIRDSHTNMDEDSLCLGCNDTRGMGVFNFGLNLTLYT
jgi:hypothetical protein